MGYLLDCLHLRVSVKSTRKVTTEWLSNTQIRWRSRGSAENRENCTPAKLFGRSRLWTFVFVTRSDILVSQMNSIRAIITRISILFYLSRGTRQTPDSTDKTTFTISRQSVVSKTRAIWRTLTNPRYPSISRIWRMYLPVWKRLNQ